MKSVSILLILALITGALYLGMQPSRPNEIDAPSQKLEQQVRRGEQHIKTSHFKEKNGCKAIWDELIDGVFFVVDVAECASEIYTSCFTVAEKGYKSVRDAINKYNSDYSQSYEAVINDVIYQNKKYNKEGPFGPHPSGRIMIFNMSPYLLNRTALAQTEGCFTRYPVSGLTRGYATGFNYGHEIGSNKPAVGSLTYQMFTQLDPDTQQTIPYNCNFQMSWTISPDKSQSQQTWSYQLIVSVYKNQQWVQIQSQSDIWKYCQVTTGLQSTPRGQQQDYSPWIGFFIYGEQQPSRQIEENLMAQSFEKIQSI